MAVAFNDDNYDNAATFSGFLLTWLDDETLQVKLDGFYVTTLNHDELGWSGLYNTVAVIRKVAELQGLEVTEI